MLVSEIIKRVRNDLDDHGTVGYTELNILNTIGAKANMRDDMHNGMVEAMKRRNEVKKEEYYKEYKESDARVDVPEWLIRSEETA